LTAIYFSLADFVVAAVRPRTPLAKAIMLVLVIKLIGIVGIRILMFPDSAQPAVSATAMAHVLGVSVPAP
jgi:hypothetical protein